METLCLPGLVISIVGLLGTPRNLAGWSFFLGIYGTLHLPTIYLFLFRA